MVKRYSAKRNMIREALLELDHPTASDVYDYIRKEYPNISLGTVYRNLSEMAEDGEILRLSMSNSPDRFDFNTEDHYHVVCTECGHILDTGEGLDAKLLSDLDRVVEASTGLFVKSRYLLFYGICRECMKKDSGKE